MATAISVYKTRICSQQGLLRQARLPLILLGLSLGLTACDRDTAAAGNKEGIEEDLGLVVLQAGMERLSAGIAAEEGVRAVKRLQYAYGHYSELGLWHDFADLFSDQAVGHYPPNGDLGREEIRALFLDIVGQGSLGLAQGRLYPHISFSPVITLAEDGNSAQARFRILAMLGAYGGNASWAHGVYENAYIKEAGIWKVNEVAFAMEIGGRYEQGLVPQAGLSLTEPAAPFHYTVANAGQPVSTAMAQPQVFESATPVSVSELSAQLTALEQQADRLDDEAAVLNLQHTYAYYADRKSWDDMADLFADSATLELGQGGVYVGKTSIRNALNQFGPPGLGEGELDEHLQFQTYVSVAPDGLTAKARVDQLGMKGMRGGNAEWNQGIYENEYAKVDGEWQFTRLHYYPRLITAYGLGWGKDAQQTAGINADYPPDALPTEVYENYPAFYIPAFHFAHPVTGRAPQYPDDSPAANMPPGFTDAAAAEPSDNAAASPASLQSRFNEAAAKLKRAQAYDATENLINAYGFYLDECMMHEAGLLFADNGSNRLPGADASLGAANIEQALKQVYCPNGRVAGEFTMHHFIQPLIDVAADGLSARIKVRLWLLQAATETEDYYRAGNYEGRAVNENGVWKLADLNLTYTWSTTVSEGWAHTK